MLPGHIIYHKHKENSGHTVRGYPNDSVLEILLARARKAVCHTLGTRKGVPKDPFSDSVSAPYKSQKLTSGTVPVPLENSTFFSKTKTNESPQTITSFVPEMMQTFN